MRYSQTGWEYYLDNEHTSGSPLSLADGVRTKISINGSGDSETGQSLPGQTPLWDTTNDLVTCDQAGKLLLIRPFLIAQGDVNSVELVLDYSIPTTGINQLQEDKFLRYSTNTYRMTNTQLFWCDADVVANGIELYVTARGGAADVWSKAISVAVVHDTSIFGV